MSRSRRRVLERRSWLHLRFWVVLVVGSAGGEGEVG
jgi:hypothetical protein